MHATEAFELYAKTAWKLHRQFVSTSARCVQCGISEHWSELSKYTGVCAFCLHNAKLEPIDREAEKGELDYYLNGLSGHQEYDALLMVSGGKDSAWLLEWLRTVHPRLNILCVLVDNGFLPDQARINAQHCAEQAECDLLISKPSTMMGRLRLATKKCVYTGAYGSIDYTDGTIIHDIGYTIAAEKNIPCVISGLSWVQVEEIFLVESWKMPSNHLNVERSHWKPDRYNYHPEVIFPFYALMKDEQEIIQDVEASGLLPSGSPLQTNSRLITLMAAIDVCNHGASSFEKEFCKGIRNGKGSKDVWEPRFSLLEHCGKTGFLIKSETEHLLDKLGLSGQDLNIGWAK